MSRLIHRSPVVENRVDGDPNVCWLCNGEKRVEFDFFDEKAEEWRTGVYDPCPECKEGRT